QRLPARVADRPEREDRPRLPAGAAARAGPERWCPRRRSRPARLSTAGSQAVRLAEAAPGRPETTSAEAAIRVADRRRTGPMSILGASANEQATATDHRPLRLVFDAGTLIVEGAPEDEELGLPGVKYDFRTRQFRAQAIFYRMIVEQLRAKKRAYQDAARAYERAEWRAPGGQGAVPRP